MCSRKNGLKVRFNNVNKYAYDNRKERYNIDLVVIKRIDLMVFEHNCFATFKMGFAV